MKLVVVEFPDGFSFRSHPVGLSPVEHAYLLKSDGWTAEKVRVVEDLIRSVARAGAR